MCLRGFPPDTPTSSHSSHRDTEMHLFGDFKIAQLYTYSKILMPQIILPLKNKCVAITGSDCIGGVSPVYPEGGVPRCRTCDAAV